MPELDRTAFSFPAPPTQARGPRHRAYGGDLLEVRLDAVAAVLLDGLSYGRAGRMIGISKTEVGDSLDLLRGELAALGLCQPTAPSSPASTTCVRCWWKWPKPARRSW